MRRGCSTLPVVFTLYNLCKERLNNQNKDFRAELRTAYFPTGGKILRISFAL
jgi:hypothetical protein